MESKIKGMSKDLIMAMYEHLYYFEHEIVPNPGGYCIREKKLDNFMKEHEITIDKSLVAKHTVNNHIKFKNAKTSVPISILTHIRNSFAHGNMELGEDGNWIITDYTDEHRNVLTAYAIIEKDILFEFLHLLEQSKSNWQKQIEESKQKKTKKKNTKKAKKNKIKQN